MSETYRQRRQTSRTTVVVRFLGILALIVAVYLLFTPVDGDIVSGMPGTSTAHLVQSNDCGTLFDQHNTSSAACSDGRQNQWIFIVGLAFVGAVLILMPRIAARYDR